MALHLPIGIFEPAMGWSRYRDANPVPGIANARSVRVNYVTDVAKACGQTNHI